MSNIDDEIEDLVDELLMDITTKKPDVVKPLTQAIKKIITDARVDERQKTLLKVLFNFTDTPEHTAISKYVDKELKENK